MVGVSADSQARNHEFRRALELPYALVGDPEGRILRAYRVRWPLLGLARRVTYLVGRDRRVLSSFRSELDADAHVREACALAAGPR